jgi:4-hydroxybutyryl-CoA dehydratase/vinylacetyl-CoA-Delta-isomerase
MLMSGNDYRESLRRYRPRVYVNGRQVARWRTSPARARRQRARAVVRLRAARGLAPVMRASRPDFAGGRPVNRMNAVPASSQDLLNKLEAVRLLCQ